MPLEAVTFDYWNTLVHETRGQMRDLRLEAWAGILEGTGFAVERQHLEQAMAVSWEQYVASWHANEQYDAVRGAIAGIESLGLDVPDDLEADLVDAFCNAGAAAELHLCPGVADAIDTLKSAGVRVGIVCDVGMTASPHLRAFLDSQGLLAKFDHWSFSDEVGVYKPDPAIFRHALDGLGVTDPGAAAHVGDLRRTDIAGARSMGMTSVRYRGVFDDEPEPADEDPGHQRVFPVDRDSPEAHHVIDDHALLPGVLGVTAGHG